MEGRRTIRSIRLSNFLTFGPDAPEIPLEPLNVLIGANGSGKSNFLAAFDVLKATTGDLAAPFRKGGGIKEWLWKGRRGDAPMMLDVVVESESMGVPVRHVLILDEIGYRVSVRDEYCESVEQPSDRTERYFDRAGWNAPRHPLSPETSRLRPALKHLPAERSFLSQLDRIGGFPAFLDLSYAYKEIALFRDWTIGVNSVLRDQQTVDLPQDFVQEGLANLFLVFNDLRSRPEIWELVLSKLRQLNDWTKDLVTKVEGGALSLYLQEEGGAMISSRRMSDGTLRYLALIAILIHPSPPPLVILEEPELGLHPDLIRSVAEMLIEASERTQLIVTTHSAELVDAIQLHPEAVMVFERGQHGTSCTRLDPDRMQKWLEMYSLGELWRSGGIGGTRW